jgi:hypothetical protein
VRDSDTFHGLLPDDAFARLRVVLESQRALSLASSYPVVVSTRSAIRRRDRRRGTRRVRATLPTVVPRA